MGINIPQLNSCCWCLSLKTGVIIFGSLELFIYVLYFVDTLIFRMYLPSDINEKYLTLMNDIIFEYDGAIQLAFCCFLIYGAIKEKSGFIACWLLIELAKMIDSIWNTILISMWFFHWGFILDQIIMIAIAITVNWVIYSFYRTIPSSKYVL